MTKPTILIPCDVKNLDGYPFHCVGEKYINAIAHGANAMPIILPAWGEGKDLASLTSHYDLDALLGLVDGVCLPGSISNVHPARYMMAAANHETRYDEQRDAAVFPLIEACINRKLPLLAICRGIQELNVALGGTLHTDVHQVPGLNDHREKGELPRDSQYDPVHKVTVAPDGLLANMVSRPTFRVNSLHHQGIAKLAPGLRCEAKSDDGLVEAVSLEHQFVLGVQWHPEWQFDTNPESAAIFSAFGVAARQYRLSVATA